MVVEISMLLEWKLITSLLLVIFLRENNNHILLKDYFHSYNGKVHSTLCGTYEWTFDLSKHDRSI